MNLDTPSMAATSRSPLDSRYSVNVMPPSIDFLSTITRGLVLEKSTGRRTVGGTLCHMDSRPHFQERIGRRIKALREQANLSLSELSKRTNDVLSKSRISNWEQQRRMPGPEEAEILAGALGTSAAHVMCLDDGAPILNREEAELVTAYRALPSNERAAYFHRIVTLALAYSTPLPEARSKPVEQPKPLPRLVPHKKRRTSG